MTKGLDNVLSKKDEKGQPLPYDLSEEETEFATAIIDASDGMSDLAKRAYDAKEAGNQAEYERLRAQIAEKYQAIDTNLTALQGESGSRRYREIFGKATTPFDRMFERKSAARQIEEIQADIRKTGEVTDEQLPHLVDFSGRTAAHDGHRMFAKCDGRRCLYLFSPGNGAVRGARSPSHQVKKDCVPGQWRINTS